MPARHCCCCLPLRFGAFVISLFQFLGAGLIAAILWLGIDKVGNTLSKHIKIAAIVIGVYYSILALSSFIALIGTFVRSRRALSQYAYWLWWSVGVNIALDVWYLVLLFRDNREDIINDCINGSTDQDVINNCNNFADTKWAKIVDVVVMVVELAIQCWAAYIVASYAQKLEDEHSWSSATVPLGDGSNYKYQPTPGRASMEALTAPAAYPYNDATNSFGNSSAPYDPYHNKV